MLPTLVTQIIPTSIVPVAKTYKTFWVDAFTQTPFSGNPAVVIPDADDLSAQQMQLIAREMNCSETAFVSQPTVADADFQLRWFTPTCEVDLCGHATIATLHVLCQQSRFNLRPGSTHVLYLQTRSGVLRVMVDFTQADQAPWIWLNVPTSSFTLIPPELADQLLAILGCQNWLKPPDIVVDTFNRCVVDSLNRDVFIAVPKLQQLHALQPQMDQLAQLGQQQNWRGICLYTLETLEERSAAHLRFFAPQSGILEDPVTGSASATLALWLMQQATLGKVGTEQKQRFYFEQGDCLGRPGRLCIEVQDQIPKLGGQAVTILQGELSVSL
jgi:trans-2,3-dihydro-3-hydroxyanthranilate isomerase